MVTQFDFLKITSLRGTWVGQSEKHVTLDLGVMTSGPTSDIEIINK